MSFKWCTFRLLKLSWDIALHGTNLLFALLNACINTKRHKRWKIILLSTTRKRSIRRKLACSNKQRTLTTSVIAFLCCDPWYDRNAHTSWMNHNQSSEPRQQTESKRGIDASCLPFCLFFFSVFLDVPRPSIMLSLWGAAARCLSKGSRFFKHYLRLQLIENMWGNASHFPQFLDIFNCQ